MNTTYIEQQCKTILHKFDKPFLPFQWGANPYRGCFHSCIYCFARYSHRYLDMDPKKDFESKIIVKVNAAQTLRKELANPKWKKELVNLGSVCDPYQLAERKYEITRELLKVFKMYQNPLTITTKSDLITRDIDILQDYSKNTFLNVVFSISSINDEIRKEIEPRAPSTQKRLTAIKELHESGLKVGVLMMPIVPFLNDSTAEIEGLYQSISEAGADFVLPGILYLQGASKVRFFEYLHDEHPELVDVYSKLYKNRSPTSQYKEEKYQLFKSLTMKYKLNNYNNLHPKNNDQTTLDIWVKKK